MPGNIAFSILTYVLAVALGFFINYLINKLKIYLHYKAEFNNSLVRIGHIILSNSHRTGEKYT